MTRSYTRCTFYFNSRLYKKRAKQFPTWNNRLLEKTVLTCANIREISKFATLQRSELKHHPFVSQATGDAYCLTTFHHLSIDEYTSIIEHLTNEFSGVPGTGHNDWCHAVPAPLGCLIKVIGAGVGYTHVEIEDMAVGIFKYP